MLLHYVRGLNNTNYIDSPGWKGLCRLGIIITFFNSTNSGGKKKKKENQCLQEDMLGAHVNPTKKSTLCLDPALRIAFQEDSEARIGAKAGKDPFFLASSHQDLFGHFYVVCPLGRNYFIKPSSVL